VLLATYTADRRRVASRPVIIIRCALCRVLVKQAKLMPSCRYVAYVAGVGTHAHGATEKPETKSESER
jgi:hypothetical protein